MGKMNPFWRFADFEQMGCWNHQLDVGPGFISLTLPQGRNYMRNPLTGATPTRPEYQGQPLHRQKNSLLLHSFTQLPLALGRLSCPPTAPEARPPYVQAVVRCYPRKLREGASSYCGTASAVCMRIFPFAFYCDAQPRLCFWQAAMSSLSCRKHCCQQLRGPSRQQHRRPVWNSVAVRSCPPYWRANFFLLGEVDAKPGPMFFTSVRFTYESYHHQVTLKAPLPLATPPKPSTAQKASVKQCCSAVMPSPTLIDKNISYKAMPKFWSPAWICNHH